jgi:hypothetical protein
MSPRLAAGMLVSVLIRRTEAAGGSAMVLKRGDETAGTVLIQLADRGIPGDLIERRIDLDGQYRWAPTGPADSSAVIDYIERRRRNDPDLWVIELDVADAMGLVRSATS